MCSYNFRWLLHELWPYITFCQGEMVRMTHGAQVPLDVQLWPDITCLCNCPSLTLIHVQARWRTRHFVFRAARHVWGHSADRQIIPSSLFRLPFLDAVWYCRHACENYEVERTNELYTPRTAIFFQGGIQTHDTAVKASTELPGQLT